MSDKIVVFTNDTLRVPSLPIDWKEAGPLISRLKGAMMVYGGVGIAAPQIGENFRVIIVQSASTQEVMINPEIITLSEEIITFSEGCLSIPGAFEDVNRAKECSVRYTSETGEEKMLHATGIDSVIVQHEIDHLNGVLFMDRVSKMKRTKIKEKSKIFLRKNLEKYVT